MFICEACTVSAADVGCLCRFPLLFLCKDCITKHGPDHPKFELAQARLISTENQYHRILSKFPQLQTYTKLLRDTDTSLLHSQKQLTCQYNYLQTQLTELYTDLTQKLQTAREILYREVHQAVEIMMKDGLEREITSEKNQIVKVILRANQSSSLQNILKVQCAVTSYSGQIPDLLSLSLNVSFPLSEPASTDLTRLNIGFNPGNAPILFPFLARVTPEHLFLHSPNSSALIPLKTPLLSWDIGAASCLLNNNTVFLCGGYVSGLHPKAIKNAYFIDMKGNVKRAESMKTGRAFAGVVGWNGCPYVFGGMWLFGDYMKTGERLSDGVWSEVPNMTVARGNFTPCVVGERVYLCGNGEIDVYLPQGNTLQSTSISIPECTSPCITYHLPTHELFILTSNYITKFTLNNGHLTFASSQKHANGWVGETSSQPQLHGSQLYVLRNQVCWVCDPCSGRVVSR